MFKNNKSKSKAKVIFRFVVNIILIALITNCYPENEKPNVTLTGPENGSIFKLGNPVTLTAEASDGDGSVKRVEFYNDSILIGVSTSAPYSISWENALFPSAPFIIP